MYSMDDVLKEWKKRIYIYMKQLCSVYLSPNIFRMVKQKEQNGQGM